MDEITKSLVKTTLDKYPDLSDQIWAKLHYMVNGQCVGKSVVRNSSVVIDNSEDCTRKQIGLRSFGNQRLRKTTQLALDQFDQGLTMERDREGNIYFRNNNSNSNADSCHVVEVMGWREPQQHSLSSDIIIAEGRIRAQSIKVFDMCEYKSHVALELQRQTVDHDKLHQLSIFCISISNIPATAAAAATKDKTNVEDAMPSNWLCIINLSAIDVLTNEKVISDIKAMQHLDLIRLPDAQLRRNWSRQESQQRPEFEEAEDGGEGGKKAAREKHRKLRKTKSDSGSSAGRIYSWMTEEEKSDSRPTRRMFTGHSKRENFPGERKEWSALIEL